MDENVCRICLQVSNEEEMTSIFDNDENSIIISNKIKSCCGVKLPKESDGLPTKICSKCKIFLTIAYKLRTICQNSDAYLRRFKVKDSEVEENEEMQLKKEKEGKVENIEDNDDINSMKSDTSFLDEHENSGDITNLSESNAKAEDGAEKYKLRKRGQNAKSKKPKEKESLKCLECGRILYSKHNLLRHMQRHKEGYMVKKKCKLSICPYCGDCFPQTSLGIHIRRHTGEKPYKCDICEKAFVRLQDLKIHKRSHTGEKPHVCSTCGKAFSRQNKLARHIRVHTGERPYKCNHCDRAFAQRNDLNLHIRRHTGEKPYECGVCGQSFFNGTLLRNHRKSESHFEEERQDRFIKIRVTNPTRSHRNPVSKRLLEQNKEDDQSPKTSEN